MGPPPGCISDFWPVTPIFGLRLWFSGGIRVLLLNISAESFLRGSRVKGPWIHSNDSDTSSATDFFSDACRGSGWAKIACRCLQGSWELQLRMRLHVVVLQRQVFSAPLSYMRKIGTMSRCDGDLEHLALRVQRLKKQVKIPLQDWKFQARLRISSEPPTKALFFVGLRAKIWGRRWAQKNLISRIRRFTEWPQLLQWIAFPVKFLTKAFIHWMPCPHSVNRRFSSLISASWHPLPRTPFQGILKVEIGVFKRDWKFQVRAFLSRFGPLGSCPSYVLTVPLLSVPWSLRPRNRHTAATCSFGRCELSAIKFLIG